MNTQSDKKLGTILGVYTPTILTILGVIMYLRAGWLTGHLGLPKMLLVVLLANMITLLTTLSFSSVATNIRVGTGGAYYIISRSLGLEIGGAIGIPLFLSQTFSVTLYAYGLAETAELFWPGVPVREATFIIILAVGVLAFMGASLALKTQLPIMVFVAVSLVALITGVIGRIPEQGLVVFEPSGKVGFWEGFAIFFPAVTGVMAGLGLSGDLKNPGRSIPLGAISANLTGFAIYMLLPVMFFIGASAAVLRDDTLSWVRIAPYGMWLTLPGLLGAIFSSAVGSMLGAPRTLQALAKDRIAPKQLGKTTGDWKELLPGFMVSLPIALAAVLLGNLNAVATVVTMFFLTVYGTVNVVAAIESLSGDPSWRPKLRIPWFFNLLGGLGCALAMFLINPVAGIIAVVAELCIWLVLSRRGFQETGGDARRGLYEALFRWALIKLAHRPMSPRNWRPHILVFVPDLIERLDLIRFGNWFAQGRGVVTVCELIEGDLFNVNVDLNEKRQKMQETLDQEDLVVFAEIDVVDNVVDGITHVAQANGMGAMASNTVLLSWPQKTERIVDMLRVLRRLETLQISFVMGRINPKRLFRRKSVERMIHVWWGGLQNNSDLMLLLAYLLNKNPEWRDAHIKVMSIASNEMMKTQTEDRLVKLFPEIRIEAEVHVVIKPKDKNISDLIHEESADAEVVFLGLATPSEGEEENYANRLVELAGDLPTVFFVKNSSLFVGELLEQTQPDQPVSPDEP